MSQIALSWALAQPGITSLILGATKPDQLLSNLAALETTISPTHLQQLEKSSSFEPGDFYDLFRAPINRSIFGGAKVDGWLAQR